MNKTRAMATAIALFVLTASVNHGQQINPQDLILRDNRFEIEKVETVIGRSGGRVPVITVRNLTDSYFDTLVLVAVGIDPDGSAHLMLFTQLDDTRPRIKPRGKGRLAAQAPREMYQVLGAITESEVELGVMKALAEIWRSKLYYNIENKTIRQR